MASDRRNRFRVPVGLPMIQFVDNHPIISVASDLSPTGLHASHVVEPMSRSSKLIQLEIPLPGADDAVWAKAEVIYDAIGPIFHCTGIRFLAMAEFHQRLLSNWLAAKWMEPETLHKIRFA